MSDDVAMTPVTVMHASMVPVDRPGIAGRRWRCEDCGKIAPIRELARSTCDARSTTSENAP